MSFIRGYTKGRPGMKQQSSLRLSERRKKKKKAWDETVTDLSVHKASPDELQRRKEAVASSNIELVKADKLKKKIRKAKSPGRSQNSNALLRETLFDQIQLQDALSKSDKMMAVVKDLFGDDPMKYRGLPNVTMAPDHSQSEGTRLPDGSTIEGPSKLDLLSESIVDKSALNDLDSLEYEDEESENEEDDGTEGLCFRPVMDMARFQRLLQQAEKEEAQQKMLDNHRQDGGNRNASKTAAKQAEGKGKQLRKTLAQGIDDSLMAEVTPASSPKVQAINDTLKIQRHLARTEQQSTEDQEEILHVEQQTSQELRKVLDAAEGGAPVSDFAATSVPGQATGQSLPTTLESSGFSGYTAALLNTVSQLTNHLRESELRLKAECTIREHLSQDVTQLRIMVDALTTDIIATQEQYVILQAEFMRHRKTTDQHVLALKTALQNHGISIPLISVAVRQATEAPLAVHSVPEIPPQPASRGAVEEAAGTGLDQHWGEAAEGYGSVQSSLQHVQAEVEQPLVMKSADLAERVATLQQQRQEMLKASNQRMAAMQQQQQQQHLQEQQEYQEQILHQQQEQQQETQLQNEQQLQLWMQHKQQQQLQQQQQQQQMQHMSTASASTGILTLIQQQREQHQLQQQQQQQQQQSDLGRFPEDADRASVTSPSIEELAEQMSQVLRAQPQGGCQPVSGLAGGGGPLSFPLSPPTQTDSPIVTGGKSKSRLKDYHPNPQPLTQPQATEEPPRTKPRLPQPVIANQMEEPLARPLPPDFQMTTQTDKTAATSEGRQMLLQQLEALNKQQTDAQNKLHNLLQFQQMNQPQEDPGKEERVSPSISPIPCASDVDSIRGGLTNSQISVRAPSGNTGGRAITLTLPRVETEGNIPSPGGPPERNASRVTHISPGSMATFDTRPNPLTAGNQNVNEEGWFALSAHTGRP